MLGNYIDSNNVNHGFLLCNGAYTTFDDPQGSYAPSEGSQLNDIAPGGDSVGIYWDSNGLVHGYLYRPDVDSSNQRHCTEDGG
jgi:hypothetical protein